MIKIIKIITAAIINFKNERTYRANVRNTIKELNKLSDHDLWDIGLSRGDIWSIAYDSHTKPAKVEVKDIQVNANLRGWV
jgi:uncharacterized protein YjiS (DUF1127 family)